MKPQKLNERTSAYNDARFKLQGNDDANELALEQDDEELSDRTGHPSDPTAANLLDFPFSNFI